MTGPAAPSVYRLPNTDALADAAATLLTRTVNDVLAVRTHCTVALAGGGTPLATYARLAERQSFAQRPFPWDQVSLVYGDERCVPSSDARSTHGVVQQVLLDPLKRAGISPQTVLPAPLGTTPNEMANAYEALLRRNLRTDDGPPVDIALLGVGTDGHIASVFPGVHAALEPDRWVVAIDAPSPPNVPVPRITLTLPTFRAAHTVILLAAGREKAEILAQAYADAHNGRALSHNRLPVAQAIGLHNTYWLLDLEAAAHLPIE